VAPRLRGISGGARHRASRVGDKFPGVMPARNPLAGVALRRGRRAYHHGKGMKHPSDRNFNFTRQCGGTGREWLRPFREKFSWPIALIARRYLLACKKRARPSPAVSGSPWGWVLDRNAGVRIAISAAIGLKLSNRRQASGTRLNRRAGRGREPVRGHRRCPAGELLLELVWKREFAWKARS